MSIQVLITVAAGLMAENDRLHAQRVSECPSLVWRVSTVNGRGRLRCKKGPVQRLNRLLSLLGSLLIKLAPSILGRSTSILLPVLLTDVYFSFTSDCGECNGWSVDTLIATTEA
jgi:hypothetical protein